MVRTGSTITSTYTLTLGEVTGVTVQSYVIDWGDGASPSIYTAAQIQALNGQVTHTYATGSISPTIIVDLIDNKGITYSAVAGKHVAASTTAAQVSAAAPVISNFYCINDVEDCWTLSGTVTDTDDPVQGDIVTFGGVLASYNLTATVGADGVFSFTVEASWTPRGHRHGTDYRPTRRSFQRGRPLGHHVNPSAGKQNTCQLEEAVVGVSGRGYSCRSIRCGADQFCLFNPEPTATA